MKYIEYYNDIIGEALRGERDDYYYHVTLTVYVNKILQQGLQLNKKPTVSNYRDLSKGRIFLCDIGAVDWWKSTIEAHAFHQFEDEQYHNVTVLKIKKDKLINVFIDDIGSEDSRGNCYYVTQPIPANIIELSDL